MYVSVHVNLSVCAGLCVHVCGYWDKSKVVCGMCVGVSVCMVLSFRLWLFPGVESSLGRYPKVSVPHSVWSDL